MSESNTAADRPDHSGNFARLHGERFDIDDQRAVDDFLEGFECDHCEVCPMGALPLVVFE